MGKVILLLITGFLELQCVKINNLEVPSLAIPEVPTILDCDYSLDFPKDEELVVKWFFNEEMYPVYQWIPEAKPQDLGILKGRLDLTYRASEEKHKVHRALKIVKLGPELSGNFTCSVSTFSSEDSQTKQMLVFVAEKSLDIRYLSKSRGDMPSTIVCCAEEVYPKPDLKLYLNNSEIDNTTFNAQLTSNGLYTMELRGFVDYLVEGVEIICELRIVEANYTVRKEAIYYRVAQKVSSSYGVSKQLDFPLLPCLYVLLIFKMYF